MRQWFQGQLVAVKDTCTITAGNTSVTVTHDLGYVPYVGFNNLDDTGGLYLWVSSRTTTEFVLTMSGADPFNDHDFEYILV